jgi:hypothetical protein
MTTGVYTALRSGTAMMKLSRYLVNPPIAILWLNLGRVVYNHNLETIKQIKHEAVGAREIGDCALAPELDIHHSHWPI